MSIEKPVSGPSVSFSGPSHGGPSFPWETFFDNLGGPQSRRELASSLVEGDVQPNVPAALDMIDAALARGELGSSGQTIYPSSRQSNLNKSVNSAPAENPASENSGEKEPPSIEEKVAEFAAEYPRRVSQRLSESHGVSLRRDYAHAITEEWVERQPDIPELVSEPAVKGENETYRAMEWGEAVRTLLEKYRRTKNTTINLEKGDWRDGEEHTEFSISAENRWFASYQKKYYAQLDAWLRELCGGERPSGGTTEPSFESPRVALITRSASSKPEGERVGPVTHAKQLQESWSDVYHTMRNTLRSEGYELGESWQFDRRLEPHTGKRGNENGTNEAYAHEHVILVVDGDVTAADLRPIIEKHVEETEWAGESAHGEEAIEVREPGELNDVAAYVADYCSIDPVELWEREPAYVGWAAAMDAGNIRTVSRSEAAREVAKVDKCRQRYESEEAEQSEPHGATVRRDDGERVCNHCGCSHDVGQEGTLVSERIGESLEASESLVEGEDYIVPDGGVEVLGRKQKLEQSWREEETWTDAHGNERTAEGAVAAAAVGESSRRREQRRVVEEWCEESSGESLAVWWAREAGEVSPPDDMATLVAEVRAGVGPSGGSVREGERKSGGRSLEGKELKLGGGEDWCPACHTENPESEECPHEAYETHP
uniref:hypothetical protein n=1 Tax=Salinibaculum salinum TaxID=3131996 RepID=UPI0030EEEA44